MATGPSGPTRRLRHTGPVTDLLTTVAVALGGLLTIGGAALLVVAFRHGQAGRAADERRVFRLAVAALAVGSLGFLASALLGGGT